MFSFYFRRSSLSPCVLLHTAFNASTAVYYGSYNRVSDMGSYIAEGIAMLVVASVLFGIVMRRSKLPSNPLFAGGA